MDESNNGNKPTQQPQEPTQQQLVELVAFQTLQSLQSLAPDLDADTSTQLSMQAAHEQVVKIPEQILPTLRGPAEEKFPTYAVKVSREGRPDAVIKAPKDFKGVSDTGVSVQSAAILALVLSPVARALLRAHGYHVEFFQTGEAPQGRIIQ